MTLITQKKEKRKRDMESLPHMANTYNNRYLREHEHFPLVIKTTVADLLKKMYEKEESVYFGRKFLYPTHRRIKDQEIYPHLIG